MALRLIHFTPMPPGQFPYNQGGPKPHYFPGDCDILTQAQRLSDYRKGNSLPRPSFAECLQDIDEQQCQRLGGDPRFCKDDSKPFSESVPEARRGTGGCSTCGHHH